MIKVIVFDFDDTVYVGDRAIWKNWGEFLKSAFEYVVEDKSQMEYILEKYTFFSQVTILDAVKICEQENLSVKKLQEFYQTQIYQHASKNIKTLPNKFLAELKKRYSLYIVSLSEQAYIEHYCKKYNIDKQNFKDIFSVDITDKTPTKGTLYKKIINQENIKPNELLVIGDNLTNDITPAENIGANTIYFSGDFNQIYTYLNDIEAFDCSKYINKSL